MSVSFRTLDAIGIIHFDRADKLNALDVATFGEFAELSRRVANDSSIRGLMFTAAGDRAFSVGADISELSKYSPAQALEVARFRQSALMTISSLNIPTLAVIDGLAMGGGLELALACTFRVATHKARFSFPEIKLGLLPGAGGTQRLPKLVGQARALDLMLTARMVEAQEAMTMGLITRLVDNGNDDGVNFLTQITQFSRTAIGAIIEAVRASDLSLSDGMQIENQQLSILNASADAIEGVSAFLEKRPPRFNQ